LSPELQGLMRLAINVRFVETARDTDRGRGAIGTIIRLDTKAVERVEKIGNDHHAVIERGVLVRGEF
jgi:hypothetical protein